MDMLIVSAGALLCAVVLTGVLLRRRRRGATGADDPMRDARRAIDGMVKDRSRNARGTIRGKGGGGDEQTARDAGYGSDTSSGT